MRLFTNEAFRSEFGHKAGSGSERTRKLWCHCLARPQDVQTPYPGPLASISVLRIHEILVRIRIRGSIPLTNGSESGRPKNICIQPDTDPQQCSILVLFFPRRIRIMFKRLTLALASILVLFILVGSG
jgi:hypothetical protein